MSALFPRRLGLVGTIGFPVEILDTDRDLPGALQDRQWVVSRSKSISV